MQRMRGGSSEVVRQHDARPSWKASSTAGDVDGAVAAKAIMVWQECKALKAQLAMSQAAGNEAAEEVEALRFRIVSLVEEHLNQLEQSEKEKEVLREEIDHLKRRAAEKQQETERTHAALQASEARCLLETAEAQQLRAGSEEERQQRAESQAQLGKLAAENLRVLNELAQARQTVLELEACNGKMTADLRSMPAILEQSANGTRVKETELEHAKQDIKELEAQVLVEQAQRKTARQDALLMRQQAAEMENYCSLLEQELRVSLPSSSAHEGAWDASAGDSETAKVQQGADQSVDKKDGVSCVSHQDAAATRVSPREQLQEVLAVMERQR